MNYHHLLVFVLIAQVDAFCRAPPPPPPCTSTESTTTEEIIEDTTTIVPSTSTTSTTKTTTTSSPSTTTTKPTSTSTMQTSTTKPTSTTTKPTSTSTRPTSTSTTTTTTTSTTTKSTSTSTTTPSTTTAKPTSTSTTTTTKPTSTTTMVLNKCSPDLISYGAGDNNNPQVDVKVSYLDYSYTQVGSTPETIATMKVKCSAIDGYNVFMQFNVVQGGPQTGLKPQEIEATVTCASTEQVWIYTQVIDGTTYRRPIHSVSCQQAPN